MVFTSSRVHEDFMGFLLQRFFPTTLLFLITFLTPLVFNQWVFALPSPASIDYEKARSSYHGFFRSKKRMNRRDKWVSVIQKFELIYKNHFPSNEAYKAIFTTASATFCLCSAEQWL